MAGYSGTSLLKKLGIKNGFRLGVVGAPKTFFDDLGELPANSIVVPSMTGKLDLIIFFTKAEKDLSKRFSVLADKLPANGTIWVAWPKKSSGVATDLSFDSVQRIGLRSGLVDVKICAIDEIWSGLKFVYRLEDRSNRSRKTVRNRL